MFYKLCAASVCFDSNGTLIQALNLKADYFFVFVYK